MPFPSHATDPTGDAVRDWLLKNPAHGMKLEPWQRHVLEVHPAFRNMRPSALPPEHLPRARRARLRAQRRRRFRDAVLGLILIARVRWSR